MGIELPEELADVATAAGVRWPEADEEKMRVAATAWREAGSKYTTLVGDADRTAGTTVSAMRGTAGEAAHQQWNTEFVHPDNGHLTNAAKGCTDAADRLDHAANQVGAAKVGIVRQLVSLAKNTDAAHTAAAAGNPLALAGLDTAVKGTAVNVAHIKDTLVGSVRPGSGVDVAATTPPVNANPGPHGPLGLLGELTGGVDNVVAATTSVVAPAHGLVGGVTGAVTDVVAPTGQGHGLLSGVTNTVAPTGQGHGLVSGVTGAVTNVVAPTGLGHGLVADLTGGVTHAVGNTVHGATGVVAGATHDATDLVTGPGQGRENLVSGIGHGAGDLIDHTGQGVGNVVTETGNAGPDPHVLPDWSDDAPTPPTGIQPGQAHPGYPGVGLTNDPNQGVTAAGLTGPPAQAALPGQPSVAPGPAPGAPSPAPAPVQGPVPPAAGFTGGPPGPAPVAPAAPLVGGAPAGGAGQAPRPVDRVMRFGPEPVNQQLKPGQYSGVGPVSHQAQPAAPLPAAPAKTERSDVAALFLVHMFPIGHLPIAATKPARQLPEPAPETDYAPGLRFPPHDHPDADLVDTTARLAGLRQGAGPIVVGPGLAGGDPLVAGLAEGHDPLGGLHERDWDRSYMVRWSDDPAEVEFAWPPAEVYPEGGSAPGEPVVLDEGTVLDRFGSPEGRVFASAGTPFVQRSLPPWHRDDGYACYQVLRPLPVWRAVSAAWFAQPGGGVRYRATYPAADLVALGYLTDITAEIAEGVQG